MASVHPTLTKKNTIVIQNDSAEFQPQSMLQQSQSQSKHLQVGNRQKVSSKWGKTLASDA